MMKTAAIAVSLSIWGPAPFDIEYKSRDLKGDTGGLAIPPNKIIMDRRDWKWWQYCAVMVHEHGHVIARRNHSKDPRSVMYWKLSWRNAPRKCKRPMPTNLKRMGAVTASTSVLIPH